MNLPLAKVQEKMRSEDRILILEKSASFDGKSLFDSTQELHAIRGPYDNLWRLKFKRGVLPNPLKQSFTSFPSLYSYCNQYFKRRGVSIVNVVDVHEDVLN